MLPKFVFAIALAITTALASVTPPTQTLKRASLSLNPSAEDLHAPSRREPRLSQLEAKGLTNARRLARGLPLKAPMRRSPTRIVPRNQPSTTPAPLKKGTIKVLTPDYTVLGYIAPSFNDFGEYGFIVSDPSSALQVNIDESNTITTINGPDSDFSFFGAIQGFSSSSTDIGPGSFNYLFVGGITQTFPDSTPFNGANSFTAATGLAETIESGIWTLNADNTITASWVNSDGSAPGTVLVYAETDDLFAIAGDLNAFVSTFETGEEVVFLFEEAA